MTQHFNWGYDRRESRQEYLEDRITQMGHDPDQYRMWHAELEALKAQKKKEAWPGAWGEKTTKKQWSTIERAIGRKLSHATDGELAHAIKAINHEIKRRKKARGRIRQQRLEAKVAKLQADGYQELPKAGKEIREVIANHKIFPDLEPGRPYEDEIRSMVEGTGRFRSYPPMRSGVLREDKKFIYVQPKALLCFVINRMQDKIAEEEEARKNYERRQEELKKWEELQKARSAQVAKDWYQQMEEANGRWRQALVKLEEVKEENRSAIRREVAMETQRKLAKHGLNTIPVPTDKPTQSLPSTDQEEQNG